jgi:RNA polymerase sigma factor (sigma-70 family)
MSHDVFNQTAAIASGDTEAFSVFYRRWFDDMLIMARQCTGRDEPTCLDIVQDAMLRVIKAIKPMLSEVEVERWLTRVVRTCALDRLRAESRRKRRETTVVARTTSEVHVDLHDRIDWLCQELARLDDNEARLLIMRHRFGWTLKQIGHALRLAPGAVDGRINRLLLMLRRKATENFHE